MLADPTVQEEEVCVGTITVAMNAHREVCAVHKVGGAAMDTAVVMGCIREAGNPTRCRYQQNPASLGRSACCTSIVPLWMCSRRR